MENALATRLARLETTVARLASVVEGVADVVADARPLVMTSMQLREAVRAAMEQGNQSTHASPPPTKKTKTRHAPAAIEPVVVSPPSSLTLAAFDSIATSQSSPEQPPPPARAPQRAPAVAVYRPPPVTAPSRPSLPPPQQRIAQSQIHVVTPPTQPTTGADAHRVFLWGNAWHYLPEEYEIPKESLEVMWRQWCCGVRSKGFRPLRQIRASDIASATNRKRLSDLKFLMKFIEQQLQDRGVWKQSPSELEADQMLRAVRSALPFTTSASKNGQKRELEDLKWHSAVTLLRTNSKKARAEGSQPGMVVYRGVDVGKFHFVEG